MAQCTLTLRLETELLDDGVDALNRIEVALISRHGAAFRALERRLETMLSEGPADLALAQIDATTFVAVPPPAWADLIRDARTLGVI